MRGHRPGLYFFPGLFDDRIATLVIFDKIDDGINRLANEPAVPDPLRQDGRTLVAPAKLKYETVPNVAFLVGARCAVSMRPHKELLVTAAGEGALAQICVVHAEKAAAPAIQDIDLSVAEVGLVFRRQPARGMEPDLVEHAAEIDKTADLGVTTAETRDVWHI